MLRFVTQGKDFVASRDMSLVAFLWYTSCMGNYSRLLQPQDVTTSFNLERADEV